jgi:hypothetical protein
MRKIHLPVLGVAALAFAATGCVHEVHHHHDKPKAHRGGPPPWAPAHGYRHKHHDHGVELVFDTDLGVYIVVGHPGIYFRADAYYCLIDGEWRRGPRWNGPWGYAVVDDLPPGLRKKYAKGSHGKGKGHGKKKDRHDD